MSDEVNSFNFCNKCDIYAPGGSAPTDYLSSICVEHGFRGICVPTNRIQEIAKSLEDYPEIIPIALLDSSLGELSTDIRCYSIHSAREHGAKEVEIYAPSFAIKARKYKDIEEDLKSLLVAAERSGVNLRYIINQNDKGLEAAVINKLCRMIAVNKLGHIGLNINGKNNSEDVLISRNFKNKTGAITKVCIDTIDPAVLSLYIKSGIDTVGVNWRYAPNLIHEYEQLVSKKS